MHAYLIIGGTTENIETKITELIKDVNGVRTDFILQKISDVRNLENDTKLTKSEPTVFVIKDIDSSTVEALNAFLKTLEEPNKNTFFILTTKTKRSVLPTIISRCQIIILKPEVSTKISKLADLLISKDIDGLFTLISEIKDRSEAVLILTEAQSYLHSNISNTDTKEVFAKLLDILTKTQHLIERNGNIKIQLTNMILTVLAQ